MILIVNCGSSKSPKIEQMVLNLGVDCKMITQESFTKQDLQNTSGIIISGAPILLTEVEQQPYIDRFSCLLNYEHPILGICFGHQIIGLLHGANISQQCPEDRTDISINIIHQSNLFDGFNKTAIFNEDHCECIDLPPNFVHTASSLNCEIEAMQHVSKPIFGVQFHPETSNENGTLLLNNFIKNCKIE